MLASPVQKMEIHMVNPIGGPSPPVVQNLPPVAAPAPSGVGAAPDRLESAAQPPKEPGIFESLALTIKGWFFSFLQLICPCWFQPPVPAPIPPTEEEKLLQRIPSPDEILSLFRRYFPEREERDEIYALIGEDVSFSLTEELYTFWKSDYKKKQQIELGKERIRANKAILLYYIHHRLRQIARSSSHPN